MVRKINRKGQSVLEYTLILGAVIAVIVAVLFKSGGVKDNVGTFYNKTNQAVDQTITDSSGKGIFAE